MEEVYAKLKEAIEAKAAATQQEAIVWQKLAVALGIYIKNGTLIPKAHLSPETAAKSRSPSQTLLSPEQTSTRIKQKDKKTSCYQNLHFKTPLAAEYLGLSTSLLEKMRMHGNGPRYAKLGRMIVYAISDLDDWVNAHKQMSTLDQL